MYLINRSRVEERSLQLTNQQAAQVAMIEIACLHKIFPSAPTQLSNWLAPQHST